MNPKKKVTLPENFFENLLDLDLKLKLNFSAQILDQLMNMLKVNSILFKIAIEYYENIGDPKYKDYQFLMENLLTDPSILKHLNKEGHERDGVKRPSGGILKKAKIDVKLD